MHYTRNDVVRPNRNEFLGIHYLWRRFSERDRKRKIHFHSWIKDLPNQIQFVDEKAHLYYANTKGKLLKVQFQIVKDGVTYKHIPSDGNRDRNLEFLTQDERRVELGKYFKRKYQQLCKSEITKDLFSLFWLQIQTNLRNQDEKKVVSEKKIITVKVGDYKYWVEAERRHDNWVDYKFLGEADEFLIEMK